MRFFRSKSEKELDKIIFELDQYLANNYKDQAHLMRRRLHDRAVELLNSGALTTEQFDSYERRYLEYTETMKNYNHR